MSNKQITNIPNGAIYLNNQIYIPAQILDAKIPLNSIIYKNKIYQVFNTNNVESNDNETNSENKLEQKKDEDDIKNNEKKIAKAKQNSKDNQEKKEAIKNTTEEEIFIINNKYYYNNENNKIMKYSQNRVNRSKKTNKLSYISFNCYDTYCMGRASAEIKYKKINNKEILYIENFTLKKTHSLPFDKHIFISEEKVKNDIINNKINTEELKNIVYARTYFMDIIKKNPYTQLIKIENDFIKKFNIRDIKLRGNEDELIPVKKVIQSAHLSIKRAEELNLFSFNTITDMKDYDGNKIVEKIECEYLKKNIKVKDDIYIILTKNMENNLINIKTDIVYIDCTYKIVPRGLKNYKFLVIIGYDSGNKQLI